MYVSRCTLGAPFVPGSSATLRLTGGNMKSATTVLLISALLFGFTVPTTSSAQNAGDPLAIEIAAARAMLKHQYAAGSIAVNSRLGETGHAPGRTTETRVRDASRSTAIAQAIQGSVRNESEVRACPPAAGKCRLSGVSALLTLSEPSISGDSAMVTATIIQNSPSDRQPTDYETVLLTLRRSGGAWVVVAERQLGIS
jgi:hypothetical protein